MVNVLTLDILRCIHSVHCGLALNWMHLLTSCYDPLEIGKSYYELVLYDAQIV